MYSAQAAIAPRQNPFLYGDPASDAEEIDYVGTSNKSVFSYDGIGHRTVDAETTGGTTTTTRYLWCGSLICQVRDGSDNALKRDLPEGEYDIGASQKLIYMPDQLSSVRDVLDATTGNLVKSYDYTPYGGVARSTGSVSTDYQYAGLFYYQQSGLYLSRTRALDGGRGRWLNRDPIREPGGINLYAYSANPVNGVDPWGLYTERECARFGLCDPNKNNFVPAPFTWSDAGGIATDVGLICLPEVFGEEVLTELFADEFGGGRRIGEYTRSQKKWFKRANAEKNGGTMKCDKCKRELESIGNKSGEPTPPNQAQVHHENPISEGGGRDSPHKVYCPECHNEVHHPPK
jgi:RHS repeat-associated protein